MLDRRKADVGPPLRMPNLQEPYRASRKANVVCALEWCPMKDRKTLERAIFLLTYPHVNGGKGYVIPISRLALIVNEDGTAKPGLSEVARRAALRLGLDTTWPTINLVCDVIMANVADLYAMPHSPPKPH